MFMNSFALAFILHHNVANQLMYCIDVSLQGQKLVPGEKDRCCYCKGKTNRHT